MKRIATSFLAMILVSCVSYETRIVSHQKTPYDIYDYDYCLLTTKSQVIDFCIKNGCEKIDSDEKFDDAVRKIAEYQISIDGICDGKVLFLMEGMATYEDGMVIMPIKCTEE